MTVELRVPTIGESVTTVEIGQWLKAEGAALAVDEPVVVVDSDKASVEICAPVAGVLARILFQEQEEARVGDPIALIEPEAGAGVEESVESDSIELAAPPVAAAAPPPGALDSIDLPPSDPPAAPDAPGDDAPPVFASPAREEEEAPRIDESRDRVVRMSPIRRRIAERLVRATRTMALLTTFNEADLSAVMDLRRECGKAFLEKYGCKLGIISFFIRATARALQACPAINAEIHGDRIIYHEYYDIGIAVGSSKGLVVPILRDAERLSLPEIERAVKDFAARAEAGKLALDELHGGTFTISNGGIYGSMLSTPILNPPQSGILGLHAIQERPVARQGEVVIRPMMYICLTYDHRIVDGREAVTFLRNIKEDIENPDRMGVLEELPR